MANANLDGLESVMPRLTPKALNHSLVAAIERQIAAFAATHPGVDPTIAGAVEAGWWLAADDLERAHICCQDLPTPLGSAWHAVMHRREGDFSNSLYWWRRAGKLDWTHPPDPSHPAGSLVTQLRAALPPGDVRDAFKNDAYDPALLVRLAERHGDDSPQAPALVIIQRLEWRWLLALSTAAAENSSSRAPGRVN